MKTNREDKTKPAILVLGRWDGLQDERVFSPEGISTTLDTNCERRPVITTETNMADKNTIELPSELKGKKFRIRKLTPRECFRLMGVDDKDIDKIQASGVSNSAQYKLAGNSIVAGGNYTDSNGNVDGVLFNLFRKMFIERDTEKSKEGQQLSLF